MSKQEKAAKHIVELMKETGVIDSVIAEYELLMNVPFPEVLDKKKVWKEAVLRVLWLETKKTNECTCKCTGCNIEEHDDDNCCDDYDEEEDEESYGDEEPTDINIGIDCVSGTGEADLLNVAEYYKYLPMIKVQEAFWLKDVFYRSDSDLGRIFVKKDGNICYDRLPEEEPLGVRPVFRLSLQSGTKIPKELIGQTVPFAGTECTYLGDNLMLKNEVEKYRTSKDVVDFLKTEYR